MYVEDDKCVWKEALLQLITCNVGSLVSKSNRKYISEVEYDRM